MTPHPEPIPLIALTLDTLCNELVSGRAVLLGDDGETFEFSSKDVRAVFSWYRDNRTKWAGSNMVKDVEAIVDCLGTEPPDLPVTSVAAAGTAPKVIHLDWLKAHRFAGIQDYCTPDGGPLPVFEHAFTKQLTVIEGANGAGKTSLLNAVCWCLTGYVYRSQRPPEAADATVQLGFAESSETDDADEPAHDVSPITPIPPAKVLRKVGDKQIPLDTWVEVSFVDDDGNPAGTVRRELKWGRAGKIAESFTGLTELKVDPIAIEIGTLVPGQLPYIQLEEASDLGKAVAEITGLRPLRDLVKHATVSGKKLRGEMRKNRLQEIERIEAAYEETRESLTGQLEERPEIKPPTGIPEISDDRIDSILQSLAEHFERLRANAYDNAKAVLGTSFDPSDTKAIGELESDVPAARALIGPSVIARHDSARDIAALDAVTEEQFRAAEGVVADILSQAKELAALQAHPDVASRLQLYAKVAAWLREVSEGVPDLATCPVCGESLQGKRDKATNKLIADHLSELIEREADHLGMALANWGTNAAARLGAALPDALRNQRDEVDGPRVLVRKALCDELFTTKEFEGVLKPLKTDITELCEEVIANLPAYKPFPAVRLPDCFDKGTGLEVALNGVKQSITFARWTQETRATRREAMLLVIGETSEDDEDKETELAPSSPLAARLDALHSMVRGAQPLRSALDDLATLSTHVEKRALELSRISLYEKAAKATDELQRLTCLVDRQVGALVHKLSNRTRQWKQSLYQPAFDDAPEVVETDVDEKGGLQMLAEAQGTTAPAHHICNTSDLRATLLAFLLAFREHVNEKRGGLSLLLLDDPQELFDRRNRTFVAESIPKMTFAPGRMIVTTNDRVFREEIIAAATPTLERDQIEQLSLHTRNDVRHVVELGLFATDISRKLKEFDKPENKNVDQPGRDYINALRVYLEQQLADLFDNSGASLPANYYLSDLVNAVSARHKGGFEMFKGRPFKAIRDCAALRPGSHFMQLMNKSHHRKSDEIHYRDVSLVRGESVHVRQLIDRAHEEYYWWHRKAVRVPVSSAPDTPKVIQFPKFNVSVVENLAAADAEAGPGEPVESEVLFSDDALSNHTTYLVNSQNFGFAAPANCLAIVDLAEEDPPFDSLVIALHEEGVYARRYIGTTGSPPVAILGSEAADPRTRRAVLCLPTAETLLLRVAGMCLTDRPSPAGVSDEAVLVEPNGILAGVEAALKVRGDSALPFALSDQHILVGKVVGAMDLTRMEGRIVVIDTGEGMLLKRVGRPVPGLPQLRHFEAVGGLGESVLVLTEDVEGDNGGGFGELPRLIRARQVLGVWYDPI